MTTAPQRHANPHQPNLWRQMLPQAVGLVALAMLTGLGFAAWLGNGPALMNALAANGLAWCF